MGTFSQKIKKAFGYDRKDLGYYRDFALGITAGLSLMYCVMFASEIRIGRGSAFDWKICIGCIAVIAVCMLLSPDKETVFVCMVAVPAGLAALRFMTKGDSLALGIFLGLMLLLGIFGGIAGYVQGRQKRRKYIRWYQAQKKYLPLNMQLQLDDSDSLKSTLRALLKRF